MKSTDLQAAEAKAQEIENILSAYDFNPRQYVVVRTDEGLLATIPSAFILKNEGWYFIFAEHHDPFVYHESDVELIYQYEITQHQDQIKEVKDFKPFDFKKTPIETIPAKGKKGFLLFNYFTKKPFFRIYEEDKSKYKDYRICSDDPEIEILDNFSTLYHYEDEEKNKLDYSQKVLKGEG